MNKKIIITGTTCTGKTTLGKKLMKQTSVPQIDLDDLHFLPNWIEKEKERFVEDVNNEIEGLDDLGITLGYSKWHTEGFKLMGEPLELDFKV